MVNLAIVVLGSGISTRIAETDLPDRQVHLVDRADQGVWSGLADRGGAVLVLADRGLERRARHHAAIASDLGLQVAWRVTNLGPLALLLAARNTAHVASDAGSAPLSFDSIAANTWSGAWLRSVARLNRPSPNLLQHMRSFLPGEGYVVELGSAPTVTAVRRLQKRPRPYDFAQGPRGPLVMSHELPQTTLEVVATTTGYEGEFVMEGHEGAAERFGSTDAIELAVLPQADPTPQVHRVTCPACELTIPAPLCPFCHVRAQLPDPVGASA